MLTKEPKDVHIAKKLNSMSSSQKDMKIWHWTPSTSLTDMPIDVSYAAPQAHGIVNVALHWEYPPGIVFIFSEGMKYLYHV
jgi:hypothetical protein